MGLFYIPPMVAVLQLGGEGILKCLLTFCKHCSGRVTQQLNLEGIRMPSEGTRHTPPLHIKKLGEDI